MIKLDEIEQQIIDLIKKENGRPIPPGIVVKLMDSVYNVKGKQKIYKAIDKLILNGLIKQLSRNNKLVLGYENAPALLDQAQEGIISIGPKNFGFIRLVNDDRATYFVHSSNLNNALNGDYVRFAPLDKKNESRDLKDALVVEVLKRAKTKYVGKYKNDGSQFVVYPDDPKMYMTVTLNTEHPELQENDKILFEIEKILPDNKVIAKLIKKIGNESNLGVDIQSIVYDLGIEYDFDKEAIVESEKLQFDFNEHQKKIRQDLTNLDIVTIDPATSKDLDDAIYVEKLENGNYRLVVAIADVSHYVQLNTALDQNAYKRSTSVYLVNEVIPMLPEKLSNDLCSLNPHEKKLALVSDMVINSFGEIVDNKAYPALIESKYRFTYRDVNDWFKGTNQLSDVSDSIKTMLTSSRELAKILRKMKHERGYVEFHIPEPFIVLNDKLIPTNILIKETGEAQSMIEDFMVCANEGITKLAINEKIPFIYRVHPKPSKRKLKTFATEVKHLDFKITDNFLDIKQNTISQWIRNNINNPNMNIINILLFRIMAKAFYSVDNTFHFGLGSKNYTHFTSPIRRYADLIVHRLLWMYLFSKDDYTDLQREEVKSKLQEICETLNYSEMRAIDCERSVNNYLFCVYMSSHIGDTYDGFISNIMNYGMFVELKNTINGLIRVMNINDDYYSYDEATCSLVGRETSKRFSIGDKVKVKVANIDIHLRQINFDLIN